MGDGAHLGVTAGRALDTILGGKPQPAEEERMSQEQFAAWILSAPHNLKDISSEDGYTGASRWLARKYLLILEEYFGRSMYQRRPWSSKYLSMADAAWADFKDKWPDDVDDAGGMTGFMHGWAWNAARNSLGCGPQPNPALLTITVREKKSESIIIWTVHKWKASSMLFGS